MLGGRGRGALLVGREVDEGCAAGHSCSLGRMLGGWETVALLVGREVDEGCAVGRRLLAR